MMIDSNKSGTIDLNEWRNFKFLFMQRFMDNDKDQNEMLTVEELKA